MSITKVYTRFITHNSYAANLNSYTKHMWYPENMFFIVSNVVSIVKKVWLID